LRGAAEPSALSQADEIQSNASDSPPLHPTPRQRGSASLRAISAARAMRMEESVPLPGAAWPGHSHESSRSQAAGYSAPSLPPRPPTPSISPPSIRRSSSRSSYGLPPRPRAGSGQSMRRSLSSCAQVVGNTNERILNHSLLVC
jgi:hypothetical protein